ncbi:uncharacterized protein LOC124885741 [Capsicum annuum]|uniref:uncharacterized protein LOC124885741 n=1 Tax=Capsicum annuum TaxID=4072 RepID=UPI001FB0B35F|nr:uncharacterized protein LOC124885741 [Capsicum annuum]
MPRPPPPFPQRLKKKEDNEKFGKFMAVMKQRTVMVPLMESLVQKKPNPGAFTIPCTVGPIKFEKGLCDLAASINLMPLAVYKRLNVGEPTTTKIQLVMVDRSIKRPVGILHNVLVKVADFILPADFVVLDCDVDFEVPIIL